MRLPVDRAWNIRLQNVCRTIPSTHGQSGTQVIERLKHLQDTDYKDGMSQPMRPVCVCVCVCVYDLELSKLLTGYKPYLGTLAG